MIYRFFGDIHGGKRIPYSTIRTGDVFNQQKKDLLTQYTAGCDCLQLGDLFDGYSASAEVFIEGYEIAKRMRAILTGNHDISKNTDKSSALGLLRNPLGLSVVQEITKFSEGMTTFVFVPHQHTQEKFEEALKDAITMLGDRESRNRYNVLCLHCNFGEHRGPETDNYLPIKIAKALMDAGFSLIVSGHEHNYREPMPGVIMLGSVLPFSFGEMETKYVLDYDTQSGQHQLVPIWKQENYKQVDAREYVECSTWNNYEFIEVVGNVDVELAASVNRTTSGIFRNSKNIIAIKNNTILLRHQKAAVDDKKEHWLDLLLAQCNTDEQKTALKELAGAAK